MRESFFDRINRMVRDFSHFDLSPPGEADRSDNREGLANFMEME
jgi:hypothetical protein